MAVMPRRACAVNSTSFPNIPENADDDEVADAVTAAIVAARGWRVIECRDQVQWICDGWPERGKDGRVGRADATAEPAPASCTVSVS